jgi:hypothetical protein
MEFLSCLYLVGGGGSAPIVARFVNQVSFGSDGSSPTPPTTTPTSIAVNSNKPAASFIFASFISTSLRQVKGIGRWLAALAGSGTRSHFTDLAQVFQSKTVDNGQLNARRRGRASVTGHVIRFNGYGSNKYASGNKLSVFGIIAEQ